MYLIECIKYKIKNIRDFREFKRNGCEQINTLNKYAIQIKNYGLNNINIECYNNTIYILNQWVKYKFWDEQDEQKIWTLLFDTVYVKNELEEILEEDYYNNLVEVIKILEKYME
jgi:hypothetical protein